MDSIHETEGLYQRALILAVGFDEAQDVQQALALFREAAAAGNANALERLAYHYMTGNGVEKDAAQALSYVRRAAALGHPQGNFLSGKLLYDQGDYAEALQHFRRGAALGDTSSRVFLGILHEEGRGVAENASKAVECYRSAAILGDLDGVMRLADCYHVGYGVERDAEKMLLLLDRARQRNWPRAWYAYGCLYESGELASDEPIRDAIVSYERAAELGVPEAQAWCGELYAMGTDRTGVAVAQDLGKGVRLLDTAAKGGNSRAKFVLAFLTSRGDGVERDERKAFELALAAANDGEVAAQYMVGDFMENGKGVEKDVASAISWYQKAAELGYEQALKKLDDLGTPIVGKLE